MSKLLSYIFFILCLSLSQTVIAAPSLKSPEINKNYQVPNLQGEGEILLQRFKLLEARWQKLSRNQPVSNDMDDLLKNLFLPQNSKEFYNNFRRELMVAKKPRQANLWRNLAHHYMDQGNLPDAASAAYMSYNLSKDKRSQALDLRQMGEIYIDLNKIEEGFNLLALSMRLDPNEETERRLNVIRERFFLIIRDISVNVEQTIPNACIVFSQKIKSGQKPEDYVTVTGLDDIDISLRGNQMCLNGLGYGQSYDIMVKQGLKGENNSILEQDSHRQFTVHDRESRVSFDQNSYVISRTKDNVVPLTTVNVKKLELELYLIHDRNLVHGASLNLFTKLDGYRSDTLQHETGSLVWQGEIDITDAPNKELKTLLPLSDMITKKENGVYVLVAREPHTDDTPGWKYRRMDQASQWLLVSDMGLMTFKGNDGLHIMARSLATADPLKKIKINLIARNNKILASTTTDKSGMAHFPEGLIRGKGGDAPVLITAENGNEDYNFLNFDSSYLDLSERGVSGRTAPEKLDAFLYTDRGVYRPGEKVNLSGLLRDSETKAVGNLPLMVRIVKPDGSLLIEKSLTGDDLGAYGLDIPLSSSAIPGNYHVWVFLTKNSDPLGNVSFQVEDFVPQRIRVTLKTDKKWLTDSKETDFSLKANFLYGPPATGLKTETHISLQQNHRPYSDYSDFQFGLIEEEFYNKSLSPITATTDDQGEVSLPLSLTDIPDTTKPLLAYLQTFVFDVSGRPVDAKIALPLRLRDVEIGLKHSFTGSLSEGDEASFEIIALDREGKPVANRNITYELVKEDYYYSWHRSGDYWNSQRHVTDSLIETGEVITNDQGRANVKSTAKDGRYRLSIMDKKGTSAASSRYYVGWWSSGSLPNVPDELELTLKDNMVNDGDLIKAFVKAPFAGKATLVVMNDKLRLSREITLPEEGREISIKANKDWGPGAYLMVTAFRPEAGKISKLPVRAMNLAWFTIDKEYRSARVKITVPKTVIPRQKISLPIELEGKSLAGKKLRLTIAAVDEGILGLTKFTSPDPTDYYLSQRNLEMSLADIYGRLIKPTEGIRGQVRTGGDMARMLTAFAPIEAEKAAGARDENATGVQTKTVKTVALFQRDIMLDQNAQGTITLDLPDYNGRLRLMAVAYGEDVIGQGDQELIVRDPVVADLLLPRFLSPGDQAETTLSLHNLSGKNRTFNIDLQNSDGLDVPVEQSFSITLAHNQRFEKMIPLMANKIGDSKMSLTVKTEGLPDISRHWDIAVRPAQPFITRRSVSYLSQGDHEVISREDLNGFFANSASTSLTLTNLPDYNVPDLLDSLYMYPYACGEQTTSRVLPLLYYGDVAHRWNKAYDPLEIRRVIDKSVIHLLDMQKHDGSFALWRSTGDSHPWLTVYIFDFLTRAREQNIDIPVAAYDHTRNWLKNRVNQRRGMAPHVMAYALYTLARTGDITASSVRYFADNNWDKIETKLGLGHLAAALKLVGENHMSDEFFLRALKKSRQPSPSKWVWYHDFGSDLRDSAALSALIAESSSNMITALQVSDAIDREFDKRKYFSTQEKAWLLLATHSLSEQSKEGFQVSLNNKPLPLSMGPLRYSLKAEAILQGLNIENIGNSDIRAIQSLKAVPSSPLKATSSGFEITRSFLTLDGKPADLNNIRQNDMLVVAIKGKSEHNIDHEALIVDLLPAGFEIENAAIGGFEADQELRFLPRKSGFLYEAARDDRYIAALNLNHYNKEFTTHYIVRAVTPGTYALPAVFVEDMYKPEYHARGNTGIITIRK